MQPSSSTAHSVRTRSSVSYSAPSCPVHVLISFHTSPLNFPPIASPGAHQNTLEWLPQVIASTLIVGLKYPVYSASLCGLWIVSRFLYTVGYSTGVPAKVRARHHGCRAFVFPRTLSELTCVLVPLIEGYVWCRACKRGYPARTCAGWYSLHCLPDPFCVKAQRCALNLPDRGFEQTDAPRTVSRVPTSLFTCLCPSYLTAAPAYPHVYTSPSLCNVVRFEFCTLLSFAEQPDARHSGAAGRVRRPCDRRF